MTTDELRTFTEMRYYQKKFFNTRNSIYLQRAKDAEKKADEILDRLNGQHNNNNNSQQAIDWSK
ncbi:MAG: hypothetical protein WCJ03_03920 [Bacteroidales bacterium]